MEMVEIRDVCIAVILLSIACLLVLGIQLEATLVAGGKNPHLLAVAHGHGLCLSIIGFLIYLDSRGMKFLPKGYNKKFSDYGFLAYVVGFLIYFASLFSMAYGVFALAGFSLGSLALFGSILIVSGFTMHAFSHVKF